MSHPDLAMKAIRHAWEGDKAGCATYVRFLADTLEQEGDASSARLWRGFLADLDGSKPALRLFPMALPTQGTTEGGTE